MSPTSTLVQGLTLRGDTWTPQFIQTIDQSRSILSLQFLDEDGSLVADEEEEYERKVMSLARPQLCIGCQACSRACPKDCLSNAPLEVAPAWRLLFKLRVGQHKRSRW